MRNEAWGPEPAGCRYDDTASQPGQGVADFLGARALVVDGHVGLAAVEVKDEAQVVALGEHAVGGEGDLVWRRGPVGEAVARAWAHKTEKYAGSAGRWTALSTGSPRAEPMAV